MKIIYSISVSLFVFGFILLQPISAITISNPGTITPNVSFAVGITASAAGAGNTTAQIAFTVPSGMTVIEYIAPLTGNWNPEISTCTGGVSYTASAVCLDLVKSSGTIAAGESLGVVVMRATAEGTYAISASSDNGYSNGTTFTPVSGTLLTASTDPNVLPNTSFEHSNFNYLTIGLFLIMFATLSFVVITNRLEIYKLIINRNIESYRKKTLQFFEKKLK